MMSEPRGQTALITGATSGIGLAFAKLLATMQYNLILVARNPEALAQTQHDLVKDHHIKIDLIVQDLAQEEAAQAVFNWVHQHELAVDILINNAGYATYGLFHQSDLASALNQIHLNLVAVTALTRLFLDDMVARGNGKILSVASTAAFQPGPLMAVYYATKAYVFSFTQALANELTGTGVSITCLCPGPTKTGFQAKAHMETARLFSNFFVMDAHTVARAGFEGLMKGKATVIPGFKNKLLALGTRFVPVATAAAIAKYLEKRRD